MPSPAPDLTKLSDAEIVEQLLAAEEDEAAAKLGVKKLKNEFLRRKEAELKAAYSIKPEPYGVVNLPFADKIVKVDMPKKIEWEQGKLDALWKQISADGADPRQYIKIEYTVSETLYKTFGDNMKAYFTPARTVKNGNPSVKIIEKEE